MSPTGTPARPMPSPAEPRASRYSMVANARSVYGVPPGIAWALCVFPYFGALVLGLMLWFPVTHARGVRLINEDRLVENATAVGDFLGALLGAAFVVRLLRRRARILVVALVAGVALMSFVIGGEEISWGQRLFHLPEWKPLASNVQKENTVHNLPAFHDLSEWIPLFLGVIGIWSIFRQTRPSRDRIGVPGLLMPCFIVIVVLAAYDNFTDWVPIELKIDTIIGQLSEYVEMLVGMCFALGMWLAMRRDARHPSADAARPNAATR